MSVFTTARGDYRWGNLYHNQKTEAFLDTHASFFSEVGGVYKEMVYDNARVQVARFVGRSEKEPTKALLKLSIYYGFRFLTHQRVTMAFRMKDKEGKITQKFIRTCTVPEVEHQRIYNLFGLSGKITRISSLVKFCSDHKKT